MLCNSYIYLKLRNINDPMQHFIYLIGRPLCIITSSPIDMNVFMYFVYTRKMMLHTHLLTTIMLRTTIHNSEDQLEVIYNTL